MFPRHRAWHPVLLPGVKRANAHGCAHPGLGGAVSWFQREPGTGAAPDPTHRHEESPFIGVLHSLQDSHLLGSCIHSGEPVYRDPTPEPTGSGTAAAPGPRVNPLHQRQGPTAPRRGPLPIISLYSSHVLGSLRLGSSVESVSFLTERF